MPSTNHDNSVIEMIRSFSKRLSLRNRLPAPAVKDSIPALHNEFTQLNLHPQDLRKLDKLVFHWGTEDEQVHYVLERLAHLERVGTWNGFKLTSLPVHLCLLSNLRCLSFKAAGLTGCIPDEIGNLVGLVELHLDENQLRGALPNSLYLLKKLAFLNVANNQLEGGLSEDISDMESLSWVSFANNRLVGTIPQGVGNLTKLVWFDCSGNTLAGPPPNLSRLSVLMNFITV
ncbi:hypothetical protein BC830DRAFT_1214817 [Chytriomyces sp. MP71]|nr:hypothetical protein BC830DRAFT_1214817 [Chytriomyces sp. MP71]